MIITDKNIFQTSIEKNNRKNFNQTNDVTIYFEKR